MSAASDATTGRPRTGRVLIAIVIVPVVLAITLLTFAWPAANLAPRDLPLGVAGPSELAQPVEQRLAEHRRRLRGAPLRRRGRRARRHRRSQVYGAVVVSAQGPTVLTASASSPLVAGVLEQSQAAPARHGRGRARVVDENRNGKTWSVVMNRNGTRVLSRKATTRAPSGSFEVRAVLSPGGSRTTVTAVAKRAATGEVCRATAAL